MNIQIPFRDLKKFPITQLFGEKFLYRGKIVSHKGVDWAMPKFTPLLAPISGVICRVEKTRTYGYGRTVYIRGDDKKLGTIDVLLAHCDDINVEVGYRVKIGNIVAYSGNSGFWRGRNGYHLHFGLKINGKYVNPIEYIGANIPNPDQGGLFDEKKDRSLLKSFLGDYVVRSGDSLWSIAKIFYGNGGHYMEIHNVNQDILDNPNKIYPGQRLRIPAIIDKGL